MATLSDVERRGAFQALDGYPSLSRFIASDPDRTALVFKRFDRLAVRSLLYLQSELEDLQVQQDEYDRIDANDQSDDLSSKQCARNWQEFKKKAQTDQKQKERMELVMKIRVTMKEYREALQLESSVASLGQPSRRTLDALRHFFNPKSEKPDGFTLLGGYSSGLYEDEGDLVALRIPLQQDRLTSIVQTHFPVFFKTRPAEGQHAYVSEHNIARFVNWISTLLAATLLIGAIVTLYVITSPKWRLGLIAAFTTLFAAAIGLLTSASRAETFAATAAYAAVLVVFVSGDLGGK
ncbi:hypothetical protein W97_01355 [Coniosporium apollinis CBS 100218]|uniref:DUF6594 domain-containing protein n=1 Tax=Coniosporium apollinis (strain CBS 100218) TaxID=1168221 RepID=R7YKK4_CONA1|nr:uncharacterized protein W97_01355 [Coniosporium apollinis CBS 100218]EON62136.1 hypothetical protein W97_01355 [Coniosporium apollinis CBS 100218]